MSQPDPRQPEAPEPEPLPPAVSQPEPEQSAPATPPEQSVVPPAGQYGPGVPQATPPGGYAYPPGQNPYPAQYPAQYPGQAYPAPVYPGQPYPGPQYPGQQYPGQPYAYPGGPQPGYPPQGYPTQGYPQPGTPQAAYPQTGYQQPYPQYAPVPGQPPAAVAVAPGTPKKRRSLWLQLGIFAVVLLLVCGGAGVWAYTSLRSGYPASADFPIEIPGYFNTNAGMSPSGVDLEQLLNELKTFDKVQATAYRRPAGHLSDNIAVAVGTGYVFQPESTLRQVFGYIPTYGFSDADEFDAGKQGGVVLCVEHHGDSIVDTLCGWADHGSVGLLIFGDRRADQAAAELL
ncbi:MAG: hypothetical protein HOV83_40060, partial [Catenulispora sp.]|nr:hypothetical protein [Catenulispora sp.]